jgi:DUF1680 family protein
VTVLRGDASELAPGDGGQALTAIPYFAWANREPAAMQVWTRTSPAPPGG